MKTKITMLFVLLLSTLGAVAQNALRLEEVVTDLADGKTVTMPVYMDNKDEVVAVEFKIAVPADEGCEIRTDRCSLASDRTAGHVLSVVQKNSDDDVRVYKVTAYSPQNKSFKGNSGKLMNIVIAVPNNWENGHVYSVSISNVIISKRNGQNVADDSMCEDGGIRVDNAKHCDIVPAITAVSPLTMVPGEQVSVSWTVKNQGEVETSGRWNTKLTITDENEKSYVLMDESYNDESLAVGVLKQFTRTFQLPEKITVEGKVKVTVELVGASDLNEITDAKANNISSTGYVYTMEKAKVKINVTLTPSVESLTEGETMTLNLSLNESMPTDMEVNVSCDYASRFRFNKVITIPAGETEATVEVAAVDDNDPALTLRAAFSVTGVNIQPASCHIDLYDNDVPDLSLSFDKARITEGSGDQILATIARTTNIDKKVSIAISDDSNNSELTYGIEANKDGLRIITLAAGQESAEFAIGVKNNDVTDGTRTVNVSASVWIASCSCGVESGKTGNVSASLTIVDDDSPLFTVTGEKSSLPEGASMMLFVKRNGTSNNVVNLAISSDNDDILEYTKQITMAADAASVTFNVKAKTNDVKEADRTVTVTVSAEGYESGVYSFIVTDEQRQDLSSGTLEVAETAAAGATIPVAVTVNNEGHGAAAAPLTVEILCSDKAMYSANSTILLATLTEDAGLDAGKSTVVSGDVVMPAAPGDIYLFARVVDSEGISTANNISAAAKVVLTAPFTVAVTLGSDVINAGGVVTINGTTEGNANTNASTNVYYIYNGIKTLLQTVTTDKEGLFTLQWAAPANMPGAYQIGGCYAGASTPDALATVNVIGLKAYNKSGEAGNSFMYEEIELGQTGNGFFKLENPGTAAIDNLSYELTNVPGGWTVTLDNEPEMIAGGETVSIQYAVTPTTVTVGKHTMYLQVKSGDLQLLNLKGQVGCVKAEAELVTDVNEINTTVMRGTSRDYRLSLTNIGNGNTGNISLALPDWMKLVNTIGSLEKDETVVAVIRMSPDGWANTNYNGNIGINAENGNYIALPFNVTVVSTANGKVKFDVCDEYTYYDPSAPKVEDASIVLRNAATNAIARELAKGVYEVDLEEGYYNFSVTAPGHDKYEGNLLVNPGETTMRTVSLSVADNINVDYEIVETEDEDGYEIVTSATFESAVPVPQITLSVPGRIKCDDLAMNESMDIQATVVNQGLVTAKDLTVVLPQTKDWAWEAVTPATFDLRPKESGTVIVRITRKGNENVDDCAALFSADYSWMCGEELKSRTVYTTSVIKTNCKPTLPAECNAYTPIVEDDGVVIARVKVQFAQNMTLTRQAFEGTLIVENNSEKAMENIQLALTETAPDGSQATSHEFEVTFTQKDGFGGELAGPWTLGPGEKGTATIKYLPTKYAATTAPVDYVFGGSLSFSTDGKERRRDLVDQILTVKPTPELNMHYFLQRDLFADDPLTGKWEPQEEGEFAVLINNVGYGEAKNLKLVTAAPELVDNENGMLIEFQFTGSQLNGGEKSLAIGKNIATDFGSIAPQGNAYAQWWMTSSSLGHFTDYNVEYTHLTESENPDLSLINSVAIHELIHSVEIGDIRGFAVNDMKDEDCTPDMMFLTDGTTQMIYKAAATEMAGSVTNTYTFTVTPDQSGWNYARIQDVTNGECTIASVTRADGSEVPLRNVWQSWATMKDGQAPVHEYNIQILDNISSETTYTVVVKEKNDGSLAVVDYFYDNEYVPNESTVLTEEAKNVCIYFNRNIKEINKLAFSLMVQGEKVNIPDEAFVFDVNSSYYCEIDLTKVERPSGYHSFTINTAKLEDENGQSGSTITTFGWVEQTGKPVNLVLAYSHIEAGEVKVLSETSFTGEVTTYNEPVEPKASYPYGTTLALKVTPNYGYNFNRWSLNGTVLSTEDTYTYSLTAPKELKIFFTPKKFNLVVNVPTSITPSGEVPMGTVVGGGSGIYDYGEEVTLTATAAQGYAFEGWYEENNESAMLIASSKRMAQRKNATLLTTNPTITYTIEGDNTIYPVFVNTSFVVGDVNEDGCVNSQDAQCVIQHYTGASIGGINERAADVNEDGNINSQDAQLIIQMYLNK